MNLDWIDFNIGVIVETNKGIGGVMSIDKMNNTIGVLLDKGNIVEFKIEDIKLPFGSMSINLTQQIGQYILLFQRIENRLRDFINYILNLQSIQKNTLTASFTAGRLIDKVSSLIKKHSSEPIITDWKTITPKLKTHNSIRNTIVHGYLFHYSENYELDFNNISIENANGNVEKLNFEKLNNLNKEVTYLYYEVHNFFQSNSQLLQDEINKGTK